MINAATLRLILLVSCAHALVHIYELSLPSVEQEIADEYFQADPAAGKQFTGQLSNYWRLLWGLGALLAGWLVDRVGGKPMLAIYLLACGAMCVMAAFSQSRSALLVAMIGMGAMAAIYHPAGLALISHHTNLTTRPRALGIHGIFGSLGIGAAPLIAWLALTSGSTWRGYYQILALPGVALGILFLISMGRRTVDQDDAATTGVSVETPLPRWLSYFTLTIMAMLQGFVYSALMSFLPRYLSGWHLTWLGDAPEASGKVLAAAVLLCGCFGQYAAGVIARPRLLEMQLSAITFGNAPMLLWMSTASGWHRAASACLLALVHFMHQPIYNSLVAKYTPREHRSLCYGFSFAMGLGLGSFGARFAGSYQSDAFVYGTLAAVATSSGAVGIFLWLMNREGSPPHSSRMPP